MKRLIFGGLAILATALGAKSVTPKLVVGELATAKLQAAIDAASAAGGGTVVVPEGSWVTGGLALKDNVTLRVPKGATLLGSTNRLDYTLGASLFFTRNAKNVAIEGEGTIDGRGDFFPHPPTGRRYRPHLLNFFDCQNVRVEGLNLRQAGTWLLHPKRCDGVVIRGLTIYNHSNQCGDGIDVSSRNVLIENCVIDADDDAIVFKTMEPDIVVENVEVRNCRLASICNFIKFGTETHGITRNVDVHDCELVPPTATAVLDWVSKNTPGCTNKLTGLAGLAFECVDGGRLEHVTVRNIKGRGMHTPIFVRQGRRNEAKPGNESVLNDILVENYEAVAESRIACSITGVPGLRPRGITLRNVKLLQQGGGLPAELVKEVPEREKAYPECHMFGRQALPAYGFYIRHADDIRFENVSLDYAAKTEVRPAFHLDDVSNVTMDAACSFRAPSDGSPKVVQMSAELRAADLVLTAKGEVVSVRGGTVDQVVAGKADDGNLSISFNFLPEQEDAALNLTVKGLYPRNWVVQSEGWTLGKWLDEQFARGIRLEHARKGTYVISKKFGVTKPKDWDSFWSKILVQVKSSLDGTLQTCYFWAPETAKTTAVPLVVGLHTWSADYRQVGHYRTTLDYARANGWAMVGPNFRGPNKTPPACGGEPAVQDIVDAIEYAKSQVKIDSNRIYIIGGSGGGHMTLLMLGRHPEIFAAGAAFCPITDVARWHADSLLDHPGRGKHYAAMLEGACGGTPVEKPEEYRRRSPLTWLARAKAAGVSAYIVTGIHDGWKGSVPVGHSFRGFNALADAKDQVSEDDIAVIEATQQVPEALAYRGDRDPFYENKNRIHFRRTSANVRFTLMEGGHGGNYPAGLDFLSRQIKGRPADFSLPAHGKGREEALGK